MGRRAGAGQGPGRSAVRRAAPVRALTAQGPTRPQNLFLIAGLERTCAGDWAIRS